MVTREGRSVAHFSDETFRQINVFDLDKAVIFTMI